MKMCCCCPGEGVGTEHGVGGKGIGLWFPVKISNLWPQVGKQIKWKIVCFDFYLVGHVLRGNGQRGEASEGALGDCRLVACCGWPLNFWRDFLLQFAATLQAKLFAKLSLRRNAPHQAKSTKQATFQLTAWTHSNFNCLPANVTPPHLVPY